MISPKSQMRVNTAVRDYMRMFPDEYKATLQAISEQKANHNNEMAEINSTHAIKRCLSTIPEKLYQMIILKLDQGESLEFKTVENQRWFLKEWPQFMVTEHI